MRATKNFCTNTWSRSKSLNQFVKTENYLRYAGCYAGLLLNPLAKPRTTHTYADPEQTNRFKRRLRFRASRQIDTVYKGSTVFQTSTCQQVTLSHYTISSCNIIIAVVVMRISVTTHASMWRRHSCNAFCPFTILKISAYY